MNEKAIRTVLFEIVSALSLCLSIFFLLPVSLSAISNLGLDASWQIALSLARKNAWVFGQDFVFTYGPLGFLITGLPVEGGLESILAFHICIGLTLLTVLCLIKKNLRSYFALLSLVFGTFYLEQNLYGVNISILLYFCFLFFLFTYEQNPSPLFLLIASLISLFLFYAKLNLGLVSVLSMLIFLLGVVFFRIRKGLTIIILCTYLLCLYVSAFALNVDLYSYLVSGLHMINGYNDAMLLESDKFSNYLPRAIITIMAFLLVCLRHVRPIIEDRALAIRILFISIFILLLFKQSFLRADEHVYTFYQYISLPLGLLCLFSPKNLARDGAKVLLLSLILSYSLAQDRFNFNYLEYRYTEFLSYLSQVSSNTPQNIPTLNETPLPAEIVEAIGQSSVDILPNEIARLYFAHLNYKPRPVIQSYLAYDGYLDGLNAEKYLSEDIPDFLIFAPHCLDNRYCFFDESKTKLAILEHYKPALISEGWLLLKKHENVLKPEVHDIKTGIAKFGERMPMPYPEGLIYIHAKIDYSLLGNIARFFYRPPELNIVFEFVDKSRKTYRAILPIVQAGVPVSRFITSAEDSQKFFEGKFEKLKKVRVVKFTSKSPWGFKKDFSYELKSLKNE